MFPASQAACAARFLYDKVLGREREVFPIPMPRCRPDSLSYWPARRLHFGQRGHYDFALSWVILCWTNHFLHVKVHKRENYFQ